MRWYPPNAGWLPLGGILTALATMALFGCTETKFVTVHKPPNLGPPQAEAHNIKTLRTYRPKRGSAEQANYYGASGCGVERWAVKTLTDPGANQVNLTPQGTSIADLVSIAPPVQPTDRVGPTETQMFTLTGTLILIKQEGDGDYHMVIEDQLGNTMIAESANPSCASGSVVYRQIKEVRETLNAAYPSIPAKPSAGMTITGVGFFDRIHGQTGVARNGVELHPVVAIQFTPTGLVPPPVKLTGAKGTD